ncbi:MAG: hypothetical protein QG653_284 [Patescibacteria group bacterium]|nr:hypothetical protein [Patescibacteria group bacterium]
MFGFFLDVILQGSVFVFYVVAFSFLFWMAVDAAKQDKIFWLLIIVGLPLVGSIIYYFVEKKKDYVTTSGHFGHIYRSKKYVPPPKVEER